MLPVMATKEYVGQRIIRKYEASRIHAPILAQVDSGNHGHGWEAGGTEPEVTLKKSCKNLAPAATALDRRTIVDTR